MECSGSTSADPLVEVNMQRQVGGTWVPMEPVSRGVLWDSYGLLEKGTRVVVVAQNTSGALLSVKIARVLRHGEEEAVEVQCDYREGHCRPGATAYIFASSAKKAAADGDWETDQYICVYAKPYDQPPPARPYKVLYMRIKDD